MLGFRTACALGAALVLLAGCDSATDEQPLDPNPPEVSDFAFTPLRVDFDDVIENDSANVPVSITLRASDDGQIQRVGYVIEGQFEGTVAQGALEANGDGTYTATTTVRLGRDQRGRYSILAYAVDDDGLLSNQVRGLFVLEGVGLGPPVIDAVDGPAEFQPPGTLRFVVTVSDPDGPGDVARVELTAPTGGIFELFDDGRSLGDEEAGDGRYTASFDVPEAAPGPQVFVFRAFDRDGIASTDVPFTVTVVE